MGMTKTTSARPRGPHLDLGHRKILPQTHPWSISKSQQVFVPLYLRPSLFCSSFIVIRIQPPFGVKFSRIISPQFLGHIDANDGDADEGPFGDKDAVHELAGRGADGAGE